jgi:hypothetical protein
VNDHAFSRKTITRHKIRWLDTVSDKDGLSQCHSNVARNVSAPNMIRTRRKHRVLPRRSAPLLSMWTIQSRSIGMTQLPQPINIRTSDEPLHMRRVRTPIRINLKPQHSIVRWIDYQRAAAVGMIVRTFTILTGCCRIKKRGHLGLRGEPLCTGSYVSHTKLKLVREVQ